MRALVTGGTGYIGGRAVAHLLERDWTVACVVHHDDTSPLPDSVLRLVDERTAAALAASVAPFEPEVVLHFAAVQDLTDTAEASDALVEANVSFGARVLFAARAAGARALVAAGTYSVNAEGSSEYAPQTLYAASKRAFGDLAEYYRRTTQLRTVQLELSDTYGPDDSRRKFLSLLDEASRTGEPLGATAGEQIVRPLHVDDVVSAFVHAGELLAEGTPLDSRYSVAGPEAVTLRQLADVFARATGRAVPVTWGARPYRPREIMVPYVGPELPQWAPHIGLAEGIAQVYG